MITANVMGMERQCCQKYRWRNRSCAVSIQPLTLEIGGDANRDEQKTQTFKHPWSWMVPRIRPVRRGGDETDLLTGGGVARTGGGLADVLVVTTTVRVVDGVHSHTTSAGPRVPLDLELVVSTTGLEQGLVDTTTAGDDADGGTRGRGDGLLGTRGQTDTRGSCRSSRGRDGGVVARGTGERCETTVTGLLLDVADNGTFGERREGEDVGNVEGAFLPQ